MKKQILKLFIVGIASLALLNSCNKDNVTQEDVIANQQLIDLAIRVLDASDPSNALDSALVEIVDGNKVLSAVTDENGLVYFEDVQISNLTPVTIKKTGFAPIYSESYTTPDDYRQIQVTRTFQLFPTSGDNMVTISGQLTIETDVTNRERETVEAGLKVKAYNFAMTTDMAFYGETDAEGKYSIQVPVRIYGSDDIEMQFPEIYTDQTVAIADEDDYTIAVEQRPTYYTLASNSRPNAIPGVPSAYAVVDAPQSATIGSGFAVEIKQDSVPLSYYSHYNLISGGSGYVDATDTLIRLTPGPDGDTAKLRVEIVNGHIVDILGWVDDGAIYYQAPTIDESAIETGSGAEIEIIFETRYRVYITDNGTGYFNYPDLFVDYQNYNGSYLAENTSEYHLSSYVDLVNGQMVNDDFADGDTIFWISNVSGEPEIRIINPETEPIFVNFNYNDIDNNLGKITSYHIREYGLGYDRANPPSIEVVAVAGYGSGAILDIDLNSNGSFSSIDIIDPGSGYVDNVNDFRDNGTTYDSYENPSFSYSSYYNGFRYLNNIEPGATYIRSAHYGTGTPVEDF